MVGNHKSGRKPNPDGSLERSKKYTFYVKEYAQTNSNGNIVSWIEDSYFQWFKRKHGAQWQERIRAYMRWEVQAWKRAHHWRCDCEPIGILQHYKHNRGRAGYALALRFGHREYNDDFLWFIHIGRIHVEG